MTIAKLMCCLWTIALLGQGFAVPAQHHSASQSATKHSEQVSHHAHHQHMQHIDDEMQQPNHAHHRDHPQSQALDIAQTPCAQQNKASCCDGGDCNMNCQHQNGDSPCSVGCEPVHANSVMLLSQLLPHHAATLIDTPPNHRQDWLESPVLPLQTPPPKLVLFA
ncbi:hypothetical protein K0504_17650 [Neiella marina]|uniref:Uncharacterized protein n=1 Tax=Neiella holothuriorum TaxID=2870530 RepID=A0ABS7EMQ5_9GAMM|nr:hypothetical protein [Neiella holothuriorum]MBW8192866.1 hypothetical protein [Neiella holothuriorum]